MLDIRRDKLDILVFITNHGKMFDLDYEVVGYVDFFRLEDFPV